ncbi:MAG TPA: iron-containing redox enzyme family protein [Blastocatellia bacterium]|nr:iron-containing redox enzyme family protein [Blastocatellia bacterium]
MTSDDFWRITEAKRVETEMNIAPRFELLRTANIEVLRKIMLQYRSFTKYYITDLGLLVSKLPPGKMRSMIGDILYEELGSGDSEGDHLRLWDRFLLSLGIDEAVLESSANPKNIALLEELSRLLRKRSVGYGIGLRGMGGECVCHVYLVRMYEFLIRNPYIRERRSEIDWRFWDIHVGEVDIRHQEMIHKAIGELIAIDPSQIENLADGYERAMAIWWAFWANVFEEVGASPVRQSTRAGEFSMAA